MTNSYEIAKEILSYLSVNRQVGHTTTMLRGALNTDCVVVSHALEGSRHITSAASPFVPPKTVSLPEIGNGALRGMNKPIVFDNFATLSLLSDLVSTIAILQTSNKELEDRIRLVRSIVAK